MTIAGLGLIGGSAGMALRRRGWSVSYVDPAVELEDAVASEAASSRHPSIAQSQSEIILVATPVSVAPATIAAARSGSTVTTACSVMAPFAVIEGVVAGHPFAGSEKRGLGAARADLFEGRPWFFDSSNPAPLVLELIEAVGAVAKAVDPAVHDRAVALTSHLPQILSTALAAAVGRHPEVQDFIGEGLRTFLRLASSSEDVWLPVIEQNRDAINAAAEEIESIASSMIHDGDASVFRDAQALMRKIAR